MTKGLFCSTPIDTARPREYQRSETREVGALKQIFRARHLQFAHFVAAKSTCSYEFSLEPEKLQPQNRFFVRGFRQFSAHHTKCHAHLMQPVQCESFALAKKLQQIFWQRQKVLRLPRKTIFDTFQNTSECRSSTPATTSAELPIGTAMRGSRGQLRTVTTVNATSSEHTLRVKQEPLLRIREKIFLFFIFLRVIDLHP